MTRLTASLLLAGVGAGLTPAVASAQFGSLPRPGAGFAVPVIAPSFNPFHYVPRYQKFGVVRVPTPGGGLTIASGRVGVGTAAWAVPVVVPYTPNVLTTGGVRMNPGRAVRPAAPAGGNGGGNGGGVVLGGGVPPPEAGPAPPPAANPVPGAPDPARVRSGEALNELAVALAKADPRGARPSAFVSPLQLDELRFGGPGLSDAAEFARRGLPFPAAFDRPALKDARLELARDFAPVGADLRAGKAADPAKLRQFEAAVGKAEAAAKGLAGADADAATGFLGRLAAAAAALKKAPAGLIDPKWASEGATAADLARHAARLGLRFAPAAAGSEEAYTVLAGHLAAELAGPKP